MIPSRGVKPNLLSSSLSRQVLLTRSNGFRKFSSLPTRRTALTTSTSQFKPINPLQTPRWSINKLAAPTLLSTASSIRFNSNSTLSATPNVTTQTPELQPETLTPTELPSLADELTSHPDTIGYLKSLGLDYGWGPTSTIQWLLEHVHVYSELGWGASIIATTLLVRFSIFYFYIQQADNSAKMSALTPVTNAVRQRMTTALNEGRREEAMAMRNELRTIHKDANIRVVRGFIGPVLQMCLGFGAFRLLRGMSSLPVPGMLDGGFLWFTNLTISDPYYVLPLLTGGIMHLIGRFGGETGSMALKPAQQAIFLYALPAFMTFISIWMPAALQISFVTTTLLGAFQALFFKSKSIRKFLKIAPIPPKHATQATLTIDATGVRKPASPPAVSPLKKRTDPASAGGGMQYQAPGKSAGVEEKKGFVAAKRQDLKEWWTDVTGRVAPTQAGKRREGLKRRAEEYERRRLEEIESQRFRR